MESKLRESFTDCMENAGIKLVKNTIKCDRQVDERMGVLFKVCNKREDICKVKFIIELSQQTYFLNFKA